MQKYEIIDVYSIFADKILLTLYSQAILIFLLFLNNFYKRYKRNRLIYICEKIIRFLVKDICDTAKSSCETVLKN